MTGKFNSTIGEPLTKFSPTVGGFLQGVGLTGVKTTVNSVAKSQNKKNKP